MAPKNTDHTKRTESNLGEFINKATYAAIKDITTSAVADGGKVKYDEATYQTYENLTLPTEDRDKAVKNVFTVATEVKQFFRVIFSKMGEDLRDAGTTAADDLITLRAKLADDTYLALILDSVANYSPSKTLLSLVDTTTYFNTRFTADMGDKFTDRVVLATAVAQKFYSFLKRFSYEFAKLNWYNDGSMTENNVLYLLDAVFRFGSDKILELKEFKRPKVVKAPSKKKDSKDAKDTKDTKDTTTPEAGSSDATSGTPAPAPEPTPEEKKTVDEELGDL